jgi:hypothetical protein
MPKTISAADQLRRCARLLDARLPDARRQVGDLLQALAAVECHFTVGGPAGVPAGLLRDLVLITGGLAGRSWLAANPDTAGAFTALHATGLPPPLPELDRILASVLSHRFGLTPPVAA